MGRGIKCTPSLKFSVIVLKDNHRAGQENVCQKMRVVYCDFERQAAGSLREMGGGSKPLCVFHSDFQTVTTVACHYAQVQGTR
jgi:hypothetical protein